MDGYFFVSQRNWFRNQFGEYGSMIIIVWQISICMIEFSTPVRFGFDSLHDYAKKWVRYKYKKKDWTKELKANESKEHRNVGNLE